MARVEGQLTLEEIGNETYEDPVLSQLRDEILEGRTGDIKRSLINMRSPRIEIKQSELEAGPVHAPEHKTNPPIGGRGSCNGE